MRSKVASLAVMLVLWLAGTVQAQTPNASVTGRVTDPSKSNNNGTPKSPVSAAI